jgi:hypothetical protein
VILNYKSRSQECVQDADSDCAVTVQRMVKQKAFSSLFYMREGLIDVTNMNLTHEMPENSVTL